METDFLDEDEPFVSAEPAKTVEVAKTKNAIAEIGQTIKKEIEKPKATRMHFHQPTAMEFADGFGGDYVVGQDSAEIFDAVGGTRIRVIEVGIDCNYQTTDKGAYRLEIIHPDADDWEADAKIDWFERNGAMLDMKFNNMMSRVDDLREMYKGEFAFGDEVEALAPNKNRLRTQRGLWELCKGDVTKYENIQKYIKASYAMATDGIIKGDEFEKAHERSGGDFDGLKSGMFHYGVIAKSVEGYQLQYRAEGV